jgi:hypothetical protein
MNDTLKVAGRIGAELGAAKAENEAMRILLRESYSELLVMKSEVGFRGKTLDLIDRIDAFLSQQAEPTDTYTAVDMATAAAQGFRDGQAAVEPAPAQDEREAFEAAAADDSFGNLRALGAEAERRGLEDGDYIDFAARKAWEYFQAGAAWQRTRPAQTEQQAEPAPAQDERDLPGHLNDAIDNLVHDNYERSQAGSRNRQADADLIRAALATRPAQDERQEAPHIPLSVGVDATKDGAHVCLMVKGYGDVLHVIHSHFYAARQDGTQVVASVAAPIAQTAQGESHE